jgi:uncharacterized membrane protein YoaK (UPF0700 family)
MFRHEGARRTHRLNRLLAGYLALVGGYVNAVGIVVLGVFTSHMTGNVSRLATDFAVRRFEAAAFDLALVGTFFAGALLASLVLERAAIASTSKAYGFVLSVEAAALVLFAVVPDPASGGVRGVVEPLALCFAMGVQNSLVTRLSGAVVRTTHLTGVITDLGIECARWLCWWLGGRGRALASPSPSGPSSLARPPAAKLEILLTIALCFGLGALAGAIASVMQGRRAAVVPIAALAAGAFYAFASRPLQAPGSVPPDSRV